MPGAVEGISSVTAMNSGALSDAAGTREISGDNYIFRSANSNQVEGETESSEQVFETAAKFIATNIFMNFYQNLSESKKMQDEAHGRLKEIEGENAG